MRSTLDEVLATLQDLETFVKSIDPVNTALATLTDPLVRGYLTVRRQLDGAAFIVVLYAAFEKFVEDLVWSRTKLEVAAVKYDELWEVLRNKHMERSATLLAKGYLGEGRYANLTPAAAIANLHQCISGIQPYELNQHAVLHHENNLRPATIQELFSLTGVSSINDLARQTEPLVQWNLQLTGILGPAQLSSIERHLDEIVKLRNQTAHTGVGSGQVLGSAEMQDHLEFIRAYCRALYVVVAGSYLDQAYIAKRGASTALGEFLEGPYRNHGDAIVVHKPSCRTYVGQPVIGKRDNRVDRWGTVQEIRIDNKPIPVVEAGDSAAKIGLRVDFKLTKGTQLYLLSAKDHAVWG